MTLKETLDDPNIVQKICTILTPKEYTRVDGIIDLVFWAAEDISSSSNTIIMEDNNRESIPQLQFDENDSRIVENHAKGSSIQDEDKERQDPVNFYDQCITRISQYLKVILVKQSRTTYQSPDGSLALSCAISRVYNRGQRSWYWFAFHPYQQEQLLKSSKGYAAFGCGSEDVIFLFPQATLVSWLPLLSQTTNEKRKYWHISISNSSGRWLLSTKGKQPDIDISEYLIH